MSIPESSKSLGSKIKPSNGSYIKIHIAAPNSSRYTAPRPQTARQAGARIKLHSPTSSPKEPFGFGRSSCRLDSIIRNPFVPGVGTYEPSYTLRPGTAPASSQRSPTGPPSPFGSGCERTQGGALVVSKEQLAIPGAGSYEVDTAIQGLRINPSISSCFKSSVVQRTANFNGDSLPEPNNIGNPGPGIYDVPEGGVNDLSFGINTLPSWSARLRKPKPQWSFLTKDTRGTYMTMREWVHFDQDPRRGPGSYDPRHPDKHLPVPTQVVCTDSRRRSKPAYYSR